MSSSTGGVVPPGAPPAPVGRRVAASLVDAALTSVVAAPLWLAWAPAFAATVRAAAASGSGAPVAQPAAPSGVLLAVGAVLLAGWGVAQWVWNGTRGWTVGRRLLGLRLVDVRSGRPVGLGRAFVRALVVALGALACGVGQLVVLLSPLFDSSGRRRGWHDRVAEGVVVDVRGLVAARRVGAWAERPARADAAAADVGADGAGRVGASRPAAGADGAPAWPGVPHPAAPGDALAGATGDRPSVDPTPSEPTRTRWSALAADRRLDGPGLVLPPLAGPGPGPDLDTRQIPVVPAAVVPAHPAAPVPLAPGPDVAAPAAGPAAPAPGAADGGGWPPPAPGTGGWPPPAPAAPPAPASGEHAAWRDALGPVPGPGPAEPPTRTGRHAVVPGAPVHPDAPAPAAPAPPRAPAPAAGSPAPGGWTPPAPAPAPPAAAPAAPPAAAPPAPPAAAAHAPTPHALGAPGTPAAPPPAPFPDVAPARAPGPGAGWAVRLPDGTVTALDGPLLVGRNPDPQAGVRTVAVADPGRSVSKTHLMLGVDEHGPWVVDRGSTNGTLVTLADGQRIVCLPDRRVRLADGSLVAFGDLALAVGLRA